MPPDTDPQLKQVILYRLDRIDQQMGRLVTTEQFHALERRLDHLERDDEERERWLKQLTISVIAAAITGLISLMIALYIH